MEHDDFLRKCLDQYAEMLQCFNQPEDTADLVFHDLLDQVHGTLFASDHRLDPVTKLSEFKEAVPIRGYGDFRNYIDLISKGAQNILTKSPVFAFYKTSGTSGNPKYIPATYHWRQRYRGPALYAQWGLYFKLLGMKSVDPGNVLDLSWQRAAVVAAGEGPPAYSITKRPSSLDGDDWLPPWHDEGWFLTGEGENFVQDSLGMLARRADHDVKIIVAVNPSKIVLLFDLLNEHAEAFRAQIADRLARDASPQLLRLRDHLESLRGQTLRLTDIWPNLQLIVCWRSAAAGKYGPWLERAAPGVAVIPFSTVGTEGIVTIPGNSAGRGSALAIGQGLYEFVPIADIADPAAPLPAHQPTLNYDQLELGGTYRLVMSQANGIYRYDTFDLYQVVGWAGRVPRLEFCGRTNVGHSFTGEKLTDEDVCHAMQAACLGLGLDMPMFTFIPVWGQPPGYLVAVEANSAMRDRVDELDMRLQKELCEANGEYAEKCETKRLLPLKALLVEPRGFNKLLQHRIDQKVSAAQVKHLWIQKDDRLLSDFRQVGVNIVTRSEAS